METIHLVCTMVYKMLKGGRVVFDSESFGEIPGDSLENCGLATKVNVSWLTDVYQFRHLSIMEFCSAVYIIRNLSGEVATVINEPGLEGCIPVVCGLEGVLNNNSDTPPIVERFVKALKLERRPSSWLYYLLVRNVKTSIGKMDDLFVALSFFEAQSPIPQHYTQHFTRGYVYAIGDDNAIRCSQELYFVDKLMEVGCLNVEWLDMTCGRQMSCDVQAIVSKLICSVEVIDIHRFPANFNGRLFAQTYSELSSSKPPIEWLTYHRETMETFRKLRDGRGDLWF